jgi:hypothetical protein
MKTRKLFGSVDEESALATLIRRNELLMEMQKDSDVLTSHVNKAENHPLTLHQHTKVLCRCQLLRRAYEIAIVEYDGETSWISCCEKAIKELAPVLSDTPKPRTLASWNRYFRKDELMPHPNRSVESGYKRKPALLEIFPEAIELVHEFAKKDLQGLTCEGMARHLREVVIPHCYNIFLEDYRMSKRVDLGTIELKDYLEQTYGTDSGTTTSKRQ